MSCFVFSILLVIFLLCHYGLCCHFPILHLICHLQCKTLGNSLNISSVLLWNMSPTWVVPNRNRVHLYLLNWYANIFRYDDLSTDFNYFTMYGLLWGHNGTHVWFLWPHNGAKIYSLVQCGQIVCNSNQLRKHYKYSYYSRCHSLLESNIWGKIKQQVIEWQTSL